MRRYAFSAAMLILAASSQATADVGRQVRSDLVSENQVVGAGTTSRVGLRLKPAAGWHVYWRNPGDAGQAPSLHIDSLTDGVTLGAMAWPYPERLLVGDLIDYGYADEVILLMDMSVPAEARGAIEIAATVSWVACMNVCVPGGAEVKLAVPIGEASVRDPDAELAFGNASDRLPKRSAMKASYTRTGGVVQLEVSSVPGDSSNVRFFPYSADVGKETALTVVAWDGRTARFNLAVGKEAASSKDLSGVLLVGQGLRARAYEISAAPSNAVGGLNSAVDHAAK